MFKPTPQVVAALSNRLGAAAVELELAAQRPDLTVLLLRAAASSEPLSAELLAAVCRAGCALLRSRYPGASIEVRVPPYAVTQVGFETGPRHTRGTPPNVVELAPKVFAALAAGRVSWAEAHKSSSGVHADEIAQAFPLLKDAP